MDLSPKQLSILERLHTLGFEIVAFPMYANYIGIRQSRNAALLAPALAGFTLLGDPTILINGNFSARATRNGRDLFIWKSQHIEATPDLLAELAVFRTALLSALQPAA